MWMSSLKEEVASLLTSGGLPSSMEEVALLLVRSGNLRSGGLSSSSLEDEHSLIGDFSVSTSVKEVTLMVGVESPWEFGQPCRGPAILAGTTGVNGWPCMVGTEHWPFSSALSCLKDCLPCCRVWGCSAVELSLLEKEIFGKNPWKDIPWHNALYLDI